MRGLHAARAALLMAVVLMGAHATAAELSGTPASLTAVQQPGYLAELAVAKMPSGLAGLCSRQPALCDPVAPAPGPLVLTPQRLALLGSVNHAINHHITSTTDEQLYGRTEYWTLPSTAGDCEDYVLLKRQTLAGLGIPLASLLITVVHDENGQGHAVLTIPTDRGDIVLDNRRDEILGWAATGYKFVKRQSAANANVWVSLANERLQATDIASAPEATPSH